MKQQLNGQAMFVQITEEAKYRWTLLVITTLLCAALYTVLSLSHFSPEISVLVPAAVMVFLYVAPSVAFGAEVTRASAKLALSLKYVVAPTTMVAGAGVGIAAGVSHLYHTLDLVELQTLATYWTTPLAVTAGLVLLLAFSYAWFWMQQPRLEGTLSLLSKPPATGVHIDLGVYGKKSLFICLYSEGWVYIKPTGGRNAVAKLLAIRKENDVAVMLRPLNGQVYNTWGALIPRGGGELRPGDQFRIGDYLFRYEHPSKGVLNEH